MKIIKNDIVFLISGKYKGYIARVERAFPKEHKLSLLLQISSTGEDIQQDIKQSKRKIDVSNVKIICPNCLLPTKIKIILRENKKRIRICYKCMQKITYTNYKS